MVTVRVVILSMRFGIRVESAPYADVHLLSAPIHLYCHSEQFLLFRLWLPHLLGSDTIRPLFLSARFDALQ